MGFEENLSLLLKSKLPCGHSVRESLDVTEQVIRYGNDDEPWLLCNICKLAWPMWDYNIRLKMSKGGERPEA